jgi:hypothetical protein
VGVLGGVEMEQATEKIDRTALSRARGRRDVGWDVVSFDGV